MADPNPLAHLWWWVEVHTGATHEGGAYYGFWSGFGSDLTEIAIVGTLFTVYRQRKCSTCWRLGKHRLEDTGQRTCNRHTTDLDHERLRREHRARFPFHLAHHRREDHRP